MDADDLGQLAKGDEKKAAITALIHSRTTVSNQWLAETLQLGHTSRVSQCVRLAKTRSVFRKLEQGITS